MTLHHRACHLCEAICGLTLEVEHDADGQPQVRSIKGDRDDPFSRGHSCPKAVALQDIQNHPDRLRQPVNASWIGCRAMGWRCRWSLPERCAGEPGLGSDAA